jgi:Cu-Zn family superoxide dismutase
MSVRTRLAAVVASAFASSAAFAAPAPAPGEVGQAVPLAMAAGSPAHASGVFRSPEGAGRGAVGLTEAPAGVILSLTLMGLPPGWHGLHLHATGDCSDPAFQSAGGHINHTDPKAHGLLNPQGPDFGDLPNVFADADGNANVQIFTTLVSLKGAGGRPRLLDADGSAVVVHANRDDYQTQPIGGAGDRIACAALKE